MLYEGTGKLRCLRCDVNCSSGKDANRHWIEVHGESVFGYTCGKCKKKFERLTQVSCHYARCRGQIASTSGRRFEIRCELCSSGYDSQRGLSQHMKAKHPEEFYRRLEVEDNRKRRGYEDAELVILVEAEVELPPATRYINKALAALKVIERKSEQIRQMRKQARYKELVQDFKLAREQTDQNLTEELLPVPQPSLCDTLKSFMKEGDSKYLEFFECACKGHAQGWPQSSVEELDQVLRHSYPFLFKERVRKSGRPELKDWRESQLSGRQRRQVRYRTTQEMWRKDRRGLAKVLLDDGAINPRPPAIGQVERVYRERFSEKAISSPSMTAKTKVNTEKGCEDRLLDPITPEEVGVAMKDQKAHSAGGPDGISVRDLRRVGASVLALIYSCWLAAGRTPQWTKRCRTTLISKTKDRTEEVGNWRPITIGSHLIRLYTKILARRLKGVVELNPLQKAFREVEGCAEHIILLHGLLREARTRNRSIFVVFLDLAKAFDSVNHVLLFRGLRRQSCPEHFIEVVKELYDGASTRISNGKSETTEIEIRSGVKQGCSLSPLLFNIVMDELVDELDPRLGYRRQNASPISIMAFADDLVLVSESLTGIECLLKKTETFMSQRGMKINPRKSYSVGLKKVGSKKQLRIVTKPFLRVGDIDLPTVGPDGSTRYLGIQFGAGGIGKVLAEQDKCDTTRLVGSALKPKQKIEFIRSFILPRWRYRLALGRVLIETCQKLDRHVRRAVCEILHSPANLSKEWIHLPIRMGGLGIRNVTEVAYLAKVRLRDGMSQTSDTHVKSIVDAGLWGAEISVFERNLVPTRGLDPCARRASLNQFRWDRWRKSTQGRGAEAFTGRLNCRWQRDGLCDRRRCGGVFIFASMLRTQTLPCGDTMVRGREKSIPSCRACGEGAETISHILQNCRTTTQMRIRRHNMVIDVVKKRLRKNGHVVLNEPRIVSPEQDQVLRPDLCAKKEGKVLILDAHVPYETSRKRLATARKDKIKKYAPHGDGFRKYLGCNDLEFDGVIVGARGAITQQMAAKLSAMGFGPGEVQLMQTRAIEGSWAIFKWFMGWKSPRKLRRKSRNKT